jgi:putative SOS response-associated peptidase YedK
MREIHERMPVILGAPDLDDWLNPEIHEQDALQTLMRAVSQ